MTIRVLGIAAAAVFSILARNSSAQEAQDRAFQRAVSLGGVFPSGTYRIGFYADEWIALLTPRVVPGIRADWIYTARGLNPSQVPAGQSARRVTWGLTLGAMWMTEAKHLLGLPVRRPYVVAGLGAYRSRLWYSRVSEGETGRNPAYWNLGISAGVGKFFRLRHVKFLGVLTDELAFFGEVRAHYLLGHSHQLFVPATIGVHF